MLLPSLPSIIVRALAAGVALGLFALASAQVQFVHLKTTSMLYCAEDNRFYVTAPSDAADKYANSICRINPANGKIESSQFVGDSPHGLILSPDGQTIYAIVAGKKMVRMIDRKTLKPGLMFPAGDEIDQLATVPDVPNALIVHHNSPSEVTMFVGGKQFLQGIPSSEHMQLGIDPARVFTYGSYNCNDFFFGINAALHTEDGPSIIQGYNKSMDVSGYGLLLSSRGDVVDPESKQFLGQIHIESTQICVDPVRPVVYEIFDDNKPTLRCWDLQTYRKLWEAPLPTWTGAHHLSAPMRWGFDGFAYQDGDYMVMGPWNLGRMSNPVDLSITRSGFPDRPKDGAEIQYTLTVVNHSDVPSTGAYVTDTLPDTVIVEDVTASQGTAVFAQGSVRGDLGPIPAHGTATIKVKTLVQNRGFGHFVAVVRSFDPDPDTSNNIYPSTTFTPHAKLGLGDLNGKGGSASVNPLVANWGGLQRRAQGSGDNLTFQIDGELVLTNGGKHSTSPTVVRFYLQDGPNLVVPWAMLLQEVEIPSIAPGETYTARLSAPLTSDSDVVGMFVVANCDAVRENGPAVNRSKQIP